MYPCDRQVLEQLLTYIDCDQLELALKTWSEHRHQSGQSCDACPYDNVKHQVNDCCMCLEGKLRTLSLYHHEEGSFEQNLQSAVRKLDAFNRQPSNVT